VTVNDSRLTDALHAAFDMAREIEIDGIGLVGFGFVEHRDGDGRLIRLEPFANLITDTGDTYYAAKAVVGIAPASPTAPTAITGMQIGSGSTVVAKSGAGGAIVTLLAGQAFDATYPTSGSLGAGLGATANYKTTFAAGAGTGTVAEATITNGAIGTASTAANTISRVLVGPYTKGAGDSVALTWSHKFLGS
jgi:hypothetical protein